MTRPGTARHICRLKIYVLASIASQHNLNTEGHIYLDLHADTCISGRTCLIWSYTGKECQVYPHSKEYETRTMNVGSFRSDWNNPETG